MKTSRNVFDTQYRNFSSKAQRKYPSEGVIRFLLSNYGVLSQHQRNCCIVLDLGCGTGRNLWMIQKEGFNVIGIDSSLSGLQIAAQVLSDDWYLSCNLVGSNMQTLPFKNSCFDVVIDDVSMQHLNLLEAENTLKEIHRVLKVSGTFFSNRLGMNSSPAQLLKLKPNRVDSHTVFNISDQNLPLAGNGQTSFWDTEIVDELYFGAGFEVLEILRNHRTYHDDMGIEYLEIVAKEIW